MSVTSSECRRCSDCVGSDHHWMQNDDFGCAAIDEPDRPDATGNEYVCKHCPVVGDDCTKCGGNGEMDGHDKEGRPIVLPCEKCNGHGVFVTRPKRFEDLEIA